MTVSITNATSGERAPVEHPEEALNKQLQKEGLRQAREFQVNNSAIQVSVSQTRVGSSILASSLEEKLVVQERQFDNNQYENSSSSKSGFDFEKVAENVLNFVGSVVRGAASGGADDTELTDLIGQARSGVAKGIALAKKDLSGFMNDEISQGIDKSQKAINTGIDDIEREVLFPTNYLNSSATNQFVGSSDTQSAGLSIKTKDGDEVEIRFASSQQYSYSSGEVNHYGDFGDSLGEDKTQYSAFESSSFVEYRGLSFSIKGDIDEQEFTAISDLVQQITDVSRAFFYGDLDTALDEALALGFDEQELEGFVLRLNRTQVNEQVSTYESIHQNADENADTLKQKLRPIAEYMDQIKSLNQLLNSTIESAEGFQDLINGVINQLDDVHVPDVLSAINRFHQFNSRISANSE